MSENPTFLEKPLPSSAESERVVLGALLLDNTLISQAVELLKEDDFYSPLHRRIFRAMIALFERGEKIEPILIGEEIKKEGELESIGGVAGITYLTYGLPHFSDIERYAQTIQEKAKLRRLIKTCNEITATALSEDDAPESVLNFAQASINEIGAASAIEGFTIVGELALESAHAYQSQATSGITHTGLLTGFREIDFLTNGLQKGDLIIVGARPRVGKTSLVLNVADNVPDANTSAEVVAIFSLEMKKRGSLIKRLVCSSAEVSADKYNKGLCNAEEIRKINAAVLRFQNKRIFIDDTPALSPMRIKSKSMMLKAREGRLDLIIIDFLQKMKSSRRAESVRLEVASVASELKNLAKELDVPVVALSSLSRKCEEQNRRPMMSDLSESNAIESEADIVAFLYRPHLYDRNANPFDAELIFAKNRNGEERTIHLNWMGEFTRFCNS